MSYGFTVYTDREAIATTIIESQTSGDTYNCNYGTGQHSVSGFTDGHYLKFTAEPADGYEFYRWVYHIGSTSEDTQYSYESEFWYYGSTGNDIFIAAEGKLIGSELPDIYDVWNTIYTWPKYYSGYNSIDATLLEYEALVVAVKFNTSGTATFYTTGDGDTVGYLTYECDDVIMNNDGEPVADDILSDDQDSGTGNNFSMSCYVEEDTVYWLWIRSNDGSSLGDFTYHIVAPESEDDYFEWSSAVAQGLPIKDVSHTEWDSFIDKIKDVLTDKGLLNERITSSKYGYAIGTTYNTMLNDCYLKYDSDLNGYPLTAQQFNVARFIIGSHVSTNLEEPEKISQQSTVYASDFFKLSQALRTWQG